MPWNTPTLRSVREMVRNDVSASLSGAVMIGNSVLRVMSDAMAGCTHLVLRYIDWLARQFLPDTAEQEWLDRHGNIWLTNADNTKGRKSATYAEGIVSFTGNNLFVIPSNSVLESLGVTYETTEEIIIGTTATTGPVRCLQAGAIGNLEPNETMTFQTPLAGIDTSAIVQIMDGGTDQETDDELRERVLLRIQNPPMGGDATDYVQWALAVPGVTRAWAVQEMGPGTITVRFLMDDLRSSNYGLPTAPDIQTVFDYIDLKRPVTVKDLFVEAPVPYFYDITISELSNDTEAVRAAIEASIKAMEFRKSKPGQTWYRSWVDEAISAAVNEDHHELTFDTAIMPQVGYMPFVRTINYD
jgi:uncharacterized phage protein gp47/JayE